MRRLLLAVLVSVVGCATSIEDVEGTPFRRDTGGSISDSLVDEDTGSTTADSKVDTGSAVMLRLMEMGLVRGAPVRIRKVAPFGGPMEIQVRDYLLSIRRAEASKVTVEGAEEHG
jgi:ferrous iron transport protein A